MRVCLNDDSVKANVVFISFFVSVLRTFSEYCITCSMSQRHHCLVQLYFVALVPIHFLQEIASSPFLCSS